jgi:arsenate reductase
VTTAPLGRRAVAEAVGTALLVAVVVGSGIAADNLFPGDAGGALLANSLATGAGLVAIILAFAPVSGAHINPAVTLAGWWSGEVPRRDVGPYVAAQLAGGLAGVVVANVMFDLSPVSLSTDDRATAATTLSEVVATFGLLVVITGLARARRLDAAPYAVGAYIAAGYWFTSSTAFANPAVTVARSLTDTFTGIAPASVPAFVAAQLAGAALAVALAGYLHHAPRGAPMAPASAPSSTAPAPRPPAVVFLCVHNAGRSQMALGWLDHLAAGRVAGYSAGSEPADRLNPVAVAAMAEVGIDIAGAQPRRWTSEMLARADVVVTMGCGDTCPYVAGTRYEDWPLDDPAGQDIATVRRIRDDIRRRVDALVSELVTRDGPAAAGTG